MDARKYISESGLRPTKARAAVLETLIQSSKALSHTEIVENMSGREFDRVTIYRVLDWLTENGLIHKISGENRAWKFQWSNQHHLPQRNKTKSILPSKAHQHAHLYCTVCGGITCIHELSPHFSRSLLKQYCVLSIDINLKGICLNCQAKSTSVT